MSPKVAVVTLTIGEKREAYERLFVPSIRAFAEKWGYDFKQIIDPIDSSVQMEDKYKLCMQKLLLPRISGILDYDWVIYIDADILINFEKAPNILDEVVSGKICAVNERSIFGNSSLITDFWKLFDPSYPPTAEEYYPFLNFPETFSKQFNAGFFCFEPRVHKDFFEELYTTYSPRVFAGENLDGDQGPLNYETNKRGLVHYMDERWNRVWIYSRFIFYKFLDPVYSRLQLQHAFKTIFDMSYCIHMVGGIDWDILN